MTFFYKVGQILCIAIWATAIYNLLLPFPGIWYTIALYFLIIMVVIHLAEWLVLRRRLDQLGCQGGGTFLKVFIFGFFWWLPILLEGRKNADGLNPAEAAND
ncbi:DUF1145 domain-containing protein [Emcibacter nanhaiensis]|nr:DUF1145 domain-containing protein [Emcibacter nanhaiensis]